MPSIVAGASKMPGAVKSVLNMTKYDFTLPVARAAAKSDAAGFRDGA